MNAYAIPILAGHAIAAFAFAVLVPWGWRRPSGAMPRLPICIALAATACWALAVAGIGVAEAVTRVAEAARNLAWLFVMILIQRRAHPRHERIAIGVIYAVVASVYGVGLALSLAAGLWPEPGIARAAVEPALVLRMIAATASLVLAHGLYQSGEAPQVRALAAALGAMWLIDLNLVAIAYLTAAWSAELIAIRGLAITAIAILIGAGAMRGPRSVVLSRAVAMQSLTLGGLGVAALVLALGTSALAAVGGSQARMLQTAFVFGTAAALVACASAPWARAWIKVKLAKHFFRHRYDYRVEWTRFTATLGDIGAGSPIEERAIKAIADLTDSPAGLLFAVEDAELFPTGSWQWRSEDGSVSGRDARLIAHLDATGRIVELDAVRGGVAPAGDVAATPQWLIDDPDAWAVVPLFHPDRLAAIAVLARPPVQRALDWEDFDLLKTAGRQVASHLAEARAQARLTEAQRFDEFNRRFAFILHDIKNLVSQLTLTARNAERHADNPAFRADMIATLTESAARMNDLLARLSQHHRARAGDTAGPVEATAVVERVAAGMRSRHPVAVVVHGPAIVVANAATLEQALMQLVANAIDASPATEPVTVAIGPGGDAGVVIEIVDEGLGMTPSFVRDELFRPFSSTKPGGFGIGAYEARELIRAMGGRIDVTSRVGEGSRFRITLPAAFAAGRTAWDRAA